MPLLEDYMTLDGWRRLIKDESATEDDFHEAASRVQVIGIDQEPYAAFTYCGNGESSLVQITMCRYSQIVTLRGRKPQRHPHIRDLVTDYVMQIQFSGNSSAFHPLKRDLRV